MAVWLTNNAYLNKKSIKIRYLIFKSKQSFSRKMVLHENEDSQSKLIQYNPMEIQTL